MPGFSPDDIRSGISQPRNKKLAEVFHRLHLIESYGTGIRRIYNLYKNCDVQPRIEVTTNTFKIVLPNMNALVAEESNIRTKDSLSPQKRQILDFIEKNGEITEMQIGEILNMKRTRAYTIAKEMRNDGFIVSVGRGANKKYIINH